MELKSIGVAKLKIAASIHSITVGKNEKESEEKFLNYCDMKSATIRNVDSLLRKLHKISD